MTMNTVSSSLKIVSSNMDVMLAKVAKFLGPYNRSEIKITRETDISNDLEIDSVAIFDLIMEVEDEYEIIFPMETISDIKTIGDLIDRIESLTA